MSRQRVYPVLLAAVATILLLGGAGCSADSNSANPNQTLPAGADLVSDAANAMREVTSAHVAINTVGEVSNLPLKRAEGDLTRSGDAKGSLQLLQVATLIEYEFVVLGDTIYLKGVTGGWQQLPTAVAATIYDPSAILDPDRGVAKLLATATEATTEATESVDGYPCYRVAAKLETAAVSALVPGVPAGVTGQLWLDQTTKQLRKAVFNVPGATPDKNGTVTVVLTDINKPVTISAPV